MADDVLLNKAAMIERTLARVVEEYAGFERRLDQDVRRLDALVLNLQRACQAAIDGAMHLVRKRGLGLPQESRDAFTQLGNAGILDANIVDRMQRMVGFGNVAVHDDQPIDLTILYGVVEDRLGDLRELAAFFVAAGS